MTFHVSGDLSQHEFSTFLCGTSMILASVLHGDNDSPHLKAEPRPDSREASAFPYYKKPDYRA